jgi:hypothetical protein
MQLGTPYFEEASQLGMEVPGDEILGDFVCGLGVSSKNPRGLTNAKAQELLVEFSEKIFCLHKHFDTWPQLLWPVLEEWALLYSAEYAERPFPYSLSLPDHDHDRVCRLRWNPFVHTSHNESVVRITTRRACIEVAEELYETIRKSGGQSPDALLRQFIPEAHEPKPADVEEVRKTLEVLLRSNLLQLRCGREGSEEC